jgi:hypothetical protein
VSICRVELEARSLEVDGLLYTLEKATACISDRAKECSTCLAVCSTHVCVLCTVVFFCAESEQHNIIK